MSGNATTQPSEVSGPTDVPLTFIPYPTSHNRSDLTSDASSFDNADPNSFAMAGKVRVFTDPLINGNLIGPKGALDISWLLASHHISQGSTPFNVRARLLDTEILEGIDRNAMYLVIQWAEQTQQAGMPVIAVIKASANRISLVIHYGEELFQEYPRRVQSRFQWFSWKQPDDIKDILVAGCQELGLRPTAGCPRGRQLILVHDR